MSDIPKEISFKSDKNKDDNIDINVNSSDEEALSEDFNDFMDDNVSLVISEDGYSNNIVWNDDISLKSEDNSINVIFNNFDFKFSLLSCDNSILNRAIKYSDDYKSISNDDMNPLDSNYNNEDNNKLTNNFENFCKNIKKWLCCDNFDDREILSEIDYKINEANTWYQFLYYYWVGLFDNIKHKRKFLEYCNQVTNLKKKVHFFSEKIGNNISITENDEKENYFRIYNFNTENIDKYDLFSEMKSDMALLEIKEIFKFLDNLLIDNIIFMKNAKAPIGDFFTNYLKIKDDCLKLSKIEDNKLFNNSRCKTEIKIYEKNTNSKKIKEEFYKNTKDEIKTFENMFKESFNKDEEYIKKDKFLFYFKEYLNTEIFEKKINDRETDFHFYHMRQIIYFNLLQMVYTIIGITDVNDLENYDMKLILLKYISLSTVSKNRNIENLTKSNLISNNDNDFINSTLIFKESVISNNEYFMDQTGGILVNKCYWKNRNIDLINDILRIIELLKNYKLYSDCIESKDLINNSEEEIISEFINSINDSLRSALSIEILFENKILELPKNPMVYYKTDKFSEKEIWWFYFVYNIESYNTFKINNVCSCCFPYKVNEGIIVNDRNYSDIETGDLENNINSINNQINNLLESKKYLYHENRKKRPDHILNKDFNWDSLEYNPDKFEYSKRQISYRNYFINELNNKDINKELKNIKKYNESLIRKQFIIDCIQNIEEVLNELDNMGNFINEGVILNDQLFFKLILFGINFLIFIGQYFWSNHIEQLFLN